MRMKMRIETNTLAGTVVVRNNTQAKNYLEELVPAVLLNMQPAASCPKAPHHASHGCFHTFKIRITEDKTPLTLNEFLSGDQ